MKKESYTLDSFIKASADKGDTDSKFHLEGPRMLQINMDDDEIITKRGAMVAYNGKIKFSHFGKGGMGLGKAIKMSLGGENMTLMKCKGSGRLYCADQGKNVQIIHLEDGEKLVVNGEDVLAYSHNIAWGMKKNTWAGKSQGGMFNLSFTGPGWLAITTFFEPLSLPVKSGHPVYSDPDATVAWTGNLKPAVKLDIGIKTFLGKGSGESVQLEFKGDSGFVIVQPYEEVVNRG